MSSAKFLRAKKSSSQSGCIHARRLRVFIYFSSSAFSAKDEITPGWRKDRPDRFGGAAVNAPMGWTIHRDLLMSLS
jgi:hypothetical protein